MASDGTLKFDTLIDSSGFQKGINAIGNIATKGLQATTAVLTTATTGIAAIGAGAIKVGSDFEAGMSRVEAISGATGEQLDDLTKKAKEMGAKTKFSAGESAAAFEYMAMAGWKTEDMLGGIEGIMNLAAASGEDLATTSDIVTDALTAFGMEAGDATDFANILAQASSNANTNVALMGDTFKYVAPVAGALGFSAEDTAVAIGLMANSGIKAGQAGTSLRAVLTRLAKPTKDAEIAMHQLGISLTDEYDNMKSLDTIMGELRDGFADLSKEERIQMATAIGGQEAMSGLLAIVNASDEEFNNLKDSIYNCDGAAERMAETMMDNLQGAIEELSGGLETLGLEMYENFKDPLKDMVKEAQGWVQQLNEAFLSGGFEGLVSEAGNVLAEIMTTLVSKAPQLLDMGVNLITNFCEGLKDNETLISAASEMIIKLADAMLASGGAIFSTGIVLISKLAQSMSKQLPKLFKNGLDVVKQIAEGISSSLPVILEVGIELLETLAQSISENLPELIPLAMEALVQFSGSLRENVGEIVSAGLAIIMALAESLIANLPVLIETIPVIITNLAGIINDNAPKLLACGLSLIVQLATGLLQSIPTLVENIPQIIQAMVSVFTAFNWVNLGTSIIKSISEGIKNLAKELPNALKTIGENGKKMLTSIDWKTAGANIINFIVNGIKSLPTLIKDGLLGLLKTAVTAFSDINWMDLGINAIKGIMAGLSATKDAVVESMKNVANSILESFKSFFGIHSPSTVMQTMGDYISQGLINGIKAMPEMAGEVFSSVVDAAKDLPSKMGEIGSNIVSGVWNGINGAKDFFTNQVSGFFSNIVNSAKSALGIHSPSTVFKNQVGEWIMPGVTEGIEDSMPQALSDVESEMSELTQKAKDAVATDTFMVASPIVSKEKGKAVKESGNEPRNSKDFIDYERFGQEVKNALDGTEVTMDGRRVGKLVAPAVNEELGKISKIKT